jgi:hypothetical protein
MRERNARAHRGSYCGKPRPAEKAAPGRIGPASEDNRIRPFRIIGVKLLNRALDVLAHVISPASFFCFDLALSIMPDAGRSMQSFPTAGHEVMFLPPPG